jgi:hypothetical protein
VECGDQLQKFDTPKEKENSTLRTLEGRNSEVDRHCWLVSEHRSLIWSEDISLIQISKELESSVVKNFEA